MVGAVSSEAQAPGTTRPSRDDAIRAVAAVGDESRRALYEAIRAARIPLTREEAAAAVGISRKLAAFHLDKLVAAGLLRAHYDPGGAPRRVGRAPKKYEPVDVDIAVSLPERQHDVLATILVDAVLTERPGETAQQSAVRVAHERGLDTAAAARRTVRHGRLGPERALTLCEGLLRRHGYEPERTSPTRVELRNCPFHPLAAQAPDLVCGLNHAFLRGVVAGLDAPAVEAVLRPRVGECCVELRC